MGQQQLWYDTIYEALTDDVKAAGGIKTVAESLWRNVDFDTRNTRLRNALNPDQAQKLDPQEVLLIKQWAREAGSTATIQFEAQALNFKFELTEPEEEQTALKKAFINAVGELKKIEIRMQANEQRLRAVK
jgi:hypothetical protein